jgi:hypothetical protein
MDPRCCGRWVSEGEGGLAGSGWHGVRGAEAAERGGDVAHSLEAAPQGLGLLVPA